MNLKKLPLLLALTASMGSTSVLAETISVSCGATGTTLQICEEGLKLWEEKTGHDTEIISTPTSSTEHLALYQQLLAGESTNIDVLMVDIVWPGILSNHLLDLSKYTQGAEKEHFASIVSNNTIDGKLVAMPWFTDAGVLYYRSDLLEKYGKEVPKTWQEMTDTAQFIQDAERKVGNEKIWGYVWQGRSYEGLMCNALEWVKSSGGGEILDKNGKVTINNDNAKEAVELASGWVGTISPEGVLNYQEEDARGTFQQGHSVFMRNWPYVWALSQSDESPVKGKVGVAQLPSASAEYQGAATLGGWNLSVSKYSKHPEIAADLVMFLTSYQEQKRRAIAGAFNPTIQSLYKDQEMLAAVPFFGDLYETFANGTARPSTVAGENYNRVSNAFYDGVYKVLAGTAEVDASFKTIERNIKRANR